MSTQDENNGIETTAPLDPQPKELGAGPSADDIEAALAAHRDPPPVAETDEHAPEEGETKKAPEYTMCLTVTMERNPIQPLKGEPNAEPVLVVRAGNRDALNAFNRFVNNMGEKTTPEQATYALEAAQGMQLTMAVRGLLEEAATRPGSDWQQVVTDSEGRRILVSVPPFAKEADGRLTGEGAINRLTMATGQGTRITAPLFGSGFTMELDPPPEHDLLAMDDAMAETKITLAQETFGMSFRAENGPLADHFIHFVAARVVRSSFVGTCDAEFLRNNLRLTDLHPLALAMATTIYPSGYTIAQPCVADPTSCHHKSSGVVNLSKLRWEDLSSLSKAQIDHMAMRLGSTHTLDQIRAYQTQNNLQEGEVIDIDDELQLELRVPFVGEFIDASYRWISDLRQVAIKAVTSPSYVDETEAKDRLENQLLRKEYEQKLRERVHEYARLATLRQYAPWIKRIIFKKDGAYMDAPEQLEKAMASLSSNEVIVEKMVKAIKSYMTRATISMVAIPNVPCPSCGKQLSSDELKHPALIPIDAMLLFFILKARRINRARNADSISLEI